MKVRNRKKRTHWLRNRILFVSILLLFLFSWWIQSLNTYMEPRLQAIAKQNVIFAINNITQAVLSDLEYDPNTLIQVDKNKDGAILSIQYDSYTLNQILYTALNTIEKNLEESDDGKLYPDGEEIFFKNGAVYECPIGYLTKIPFLSNVGPRIPIRLKMLNDVTGEIKVDSQPYGINNTLIKAYMKISVKTEVITVISTSEMETQTEIPIILQVVHGKVPEVLPYGTASFYNDEKKDAS